MLKKLLKYLISFYIYKYSPQTHWWFKNTFSEFFSK